MGSSASALVTGEKAVVFNPAGVYKNTLSKFGANFSAADSLITRYIVRGEILNSLQNSKTGLGLMMPDSVGKKIYLTPNALFMDTFRDHMMGTVLNSR